MLSGATGRTSLIQAVLVIAVLLCAMHTAIARTDPDGLPGAPTIVLPDRLINGGQTEDAPIDVRFVTEQDAPVDLGSLRIWVRRFIGWVDITGRLQHSPKAHIGLSGVHLEGGLLPAGEHVIRVAFHDTKGRLFDTTETIRIMAQTGG